MGIAKETEATFTRAVMAYARLRGWKCCHFFPVKVGRRWMTAQHGDAGFADLVFWRGPGFAVRFVIAELKMPGCKPRVEQYAFLAAAEYQMQQVYVWTPDDWKEIETVLGGDVMKCELKSEE